MLDLDTQKKAILDLDTQKTALIFRSAINISPGHTLIHGGRMLFVGRSGSEFTAGPSPPPKIHARVTSLGSNLQFLGATMVSIDLQI